MRQTSLGLLLGVVVVVFVTAAAASRATADTTAQSRVWDGERVHYARVRPVQGHVLHSWGDYERVYATVCWSADGGESCHCGVWGDVGHHPGAH